MLSAPQYVRMYVYSSFSYIPKIKNRYSYQNAFILCVEREFFRPLMCKLYAL